MITIGTPKPIINNSTIGWFMPLECIAGNKRIHKYQQMYGTMNTQDSHILHLTLRRPRNAIMMPNGSADTK
jgi:hypothetical protein